MKPLVALIALAMLSACTFVFIRGNENSITDTGGHGGGLTVPEQQRILPDLLRDRSKP